MRSVFSLCLLAVAVSALPVKGPQERRQGPMKPTGVPPMPPANTATAVNTAPANTAPAVPATTVAMTTANSAPPPPPPANSPPAAPASAAAPPPPANSPAPAPKASSTGAPASGNATSPAPGGGSAAGKAYNLVDKYEGDSFLSGFTFFDQADPTHGMVQYVNKDTATAEKLAYMEGAVTVLATDSTTDGSTAGAGFTRKSVRIESTKKYDGGLFIADIQAMPKPACSIWPAYWTAQTADWPNSGEVDILEGANAAKGNQLTLHTGPGCTLSTDGQQTSAQPQQGKTCASSNGDNVGCPFKDSDPASYGDGFNQGQGGVFAHTWAEDGIKIWQFPRSKIPQDIASGKPDPSTWGTPKAFWSSKTCSGDHFKGHSIIINTSICGDWAGASFSTDGCPGTCEAAAKDPKNFVDAKWKINYIHVYN